ncbi:MAG: hypothetical protein QOG23_502 [Blastocatellia bacterium]|jgi:hypothetical protein|nr:hypothetical protein [Blastocatellia bacterium]
MKNLVRSTLAFYLVMAALMLPLVLTPHGKAFNGGPTGPEPSPRRVQIKTGREVADRVGALKQSSKDLRNGFKIFERKGHRPKIEDAWIATDKLAPSEQALIEAYKRKQSKQFQKASFRLQQETVSGSEGEIIFIPVLSTEEEWQGTIITTAYDQYGNFVKQYTADVLLVRDATTRDWICMYEIGIAGGVPYLNYEQGMYTAFDLGTSFQSQPAPPTTMLDWQSYDPSFNPANGSYDGDPNGPGRIQNVARVSFAKTSFLPPQDMGFDYRYRNGRCPCDPPPAVRRWAGCTAAGCAGAAASCWFAGPFSGACFGSRCGGIGVACAVKGILGS